ncbi:MAG: PTS sugar transporter subunit IIA [Pyrinomonadaceae bacterium]|nr:PTS sugar transporter subunit IIA [Pyrinomonadaceae bacterium]MCX7639916.1 PTS sugar transporter subunit IIA [Pyrinomonadaceae bacterium]MDW8304088.1 PTS sugar transporter subunit IIA [Acidobacteriota bacterium]
MTKEKNKIGGVIVSHGQFASELLAAAEMIVGKLNHITAVSIGWQDDVENAKSEIEKAIKKVSAGKGVLILTDMFGGTPTNISAMFLDNTEIEIVTGVNLPMVLKLASQKEDQTVAELARQIEEQGKNSIYRARDFLTPISKSKKTDA